MACMSCSKGFLYFLNGVFMLMGFMFVGLGVYMYVDPSLSLLNQFPALPFNTMWPPLVFGGGLVAISLLGCCGAGGVSDTKGSGCKVGIIFYFIICFIMLIAQVGVLIFILMQMGVIEASKIGISDGDEDAFAEQVESAVTSFVNADADNFEAWKKAETTLECCGYKTINDDLAKDCPVTAPTKACEPALFEFLGRAGVYAMGATAGVIGIQLLAITSACCLMWHKPKQEKEAQKLDDNLNPYYG